MSRHIIKVRSQAELEAAIAAGIITPPYIAFDSSSNTTNLVLPSGREPASIDYEEETPVDPSIADGSIYLTSPITNTEYIPQDGNDGWYSTRLTFDASADVLTNAIHYPGYMEDEYSDPENWGDATGVVYKLVRKNSWDDFADINYGDPDTLTPKEVQSMAMDFIEGGMAGVDGIFDVEEVLESNVHTGYITDEEDNVGNLMEVSSHQEDYEVDLEDGAATYYLIAGYTFDPENNGEEMLAPEYCYKIGEYVLPYKAWYEFVNWRASDTEEDDYIRVPDASFEPNYNSYQAAFEDIWTRNWKHISNAADVGRAHLIVNPTVDASNGTYYLTGGRIIDASVEETGENIFSIMFNDCSIGANDVFYLVSWSIEEGVGSDVNYYFIAGAYTGESMSYLEVVYDSEESGAPRDVIVEPMDGGDSSVTSDASILSFNEEDYINMVYWPIIGTYNVDPSVNYLKVVQIPRGEADDPSQAGYSSLTDLLNEYSFVWYDANPTPGQATGTINATEAQFNEASRGDVLEFYGQFVHGQEETDEYDNPTLVVDSSKEWIKLGGYGYYPYVDSLEPDPQNYPNEFVIDNGDGTFTVLVYPNRDAIDLGYNYLRLAGATAEDDLSDPDVCETVLYSNTLFDNAGGYIFTGDEDNPCEITVEPGEGSGTIIAQVCDASGNVYTTDYVVELGGWYWLPAPTYTCPGCGEVLDYEPDSETPCTYCNYPLNE